MRSLKNDSPREAEIEELSRLWHRVSRTPGEDSDFPLMRELSPAAIEVIRLVAEQPDIILREIGESVSLPKTTLTSLIDRMEQRGFLHRIVSKRDRRSYGLLLTNLGQEAESQRLESERRSWKRVLSALESDEDRRLFSVLLRKVAGNLL